MDTKDNIKLENPVGKLTLRTTAMPADTNYHGDIFGGWLMSQMDLAGGMACLDINRTKFTTVAVKSMRFWNPVHVGDVVCVHCKLDSIGRTSVSFHINAWAISRLTKDKKNLVTEAEFVYVSIDEKGRPSPIKEEDAKAALNNNN
ncbi:MAG: acyl-CoA thioesterase [Lentisphaerota bacterium]